MQTPPPRHAHIHIHTSMHLHMFTKSMRGTVPWSDKRRREKVEEESKWKETICWRGISALVTACGFFDLDINWRVMLWRRLQSLLTHRWFPCVRLKTNVNGLSFSSWKFSVTVNFFIFQSFPRNNLRWRCKGSQEALCDFALILV